MKTRLLKPIPYIVLATMLVLMAVPFLASGRGLNQGKSEAGKLEGTWQVEITVLNCQTGVPVGTIRAFNTYVKGGSLLETGNGSLFRSPGHGVWQHVGDRTYNATLSLFRFNSSGVFSGSVRTTKTIELDQNNDEFTATVASEILDVNGNVIGAGCSVETAHRFE